jgi:hypothetical protein
VVVIPIVPVVPDPMQVTDVRALIAIGLRGQFGLGGRLPWEGNRGREYVADVEHISRRHYR